MIIALNKIDTIPEEKREKTILKVTENIKKALSTTKFKNAPIVYIWFTIVSSQCISRCIIFNFRIQVTKYRFSEELLDKRTRTSC